MKTYFSFIIGTLLLFFTACSKDSDELPVAPPEEKPSGEAPTELPDGYFEVTFSAGDAASRAAVSGPDGRVSRLRYLIYDNAGNFVKEKAVITSASTGTPSWPLVAVKDTLKKGSYTAVFLANVDKDIFPYTPMGGSSPTTAEVLTNYTGNMANARIVLPPAQFSSTTEYYWSKVTFSDTAPTPYILLQRIISLLNVHRNFVDAQSALNKLVANIVTNVNFKGQIDTQLRALLPGLLRPVLDKGSVVGNLIYEVVGGLDAAVTLLTNTLVPQLIDPLYTILLQRLTNQVGAVLTGNTDQQGMLAAIGVLLNPWALNEAKTAIVTMRNFPKTMDFNLNVQDSFTGDQRFRFDFTSGTVYNEKDIPIRGFHGLFDVIKVNVIKQGLISGLVIDQIVDGSLLLNGAFIDINDQLQATVGTNYRYKADYSFVDIYLSSYNTYADPAHPFSISIQLLNVANIDGILTGIPLLGPVIGLVGNGLLAPLRNITVTVPINLPLLGTDSLRISGSWSSVTQY